MSWPGYKKKLSLKSVDTAGGEGDACVNLRSTLCQKKPKHNRTKGNQKGMYQRKRQEKYI